MAKLSRLVSLLGASWCGIALAQPVLCDPELVRGNAGPLGYRYRDDRCEGLYARNVSGTTLRVVAVLRSIGDLSPDSPKPLTVEWTAPRIAVESIGVRLRAESLRHRTYYRMDALRPANSSSFTWPSNIVSSLRVQRQELGVTAIVRADVDGTKRDIYLPVNVHQSTAGVASNGVQLVVVPEAELKEAFLTVIQATDSMHKAPYIKNETPLMFGYYPPGRPIVIPITDLAVGVYRVLVGATLREGGSATTELWIQNAP